MNRNRERMYKKLRIGAFFIIVLVHATLQGQDANAIKDLAKETVSNYYALLNNLGDLGNTVEEKKEFKEAIIREYGERYKTIVYNDLNPKGSTHLKLPEYLSMVIAGFPQGFGYEIQIVKVFDLQSRDDLMGYYCKVVARVKAQIPGRRRPLSSRQLIFNINFEQIGRGTYGEQKIMSIDLCDDNCLNAQNKSQATARQKKKNISHTQTSVPSHIEPGQREDESKSFVIDKLNNNRIKLAELNIELVKVPGGTYSIGCQANSLSNCDNDELPVVQVPLKGFYIMEKEVTNEQFAHFLEDYGSDYIKSGKYRGQLMIRPSSLGLRKKNGKWQPGKNMGSYPVVNITWYGAYQFAQYYGFALPTEAQWEAAARGGKKSRPYIYSGGEAIFPLAVYYDNSGNEPAKVGSKIPNELDVYDMSGNVREWCLDWYKKDAYANRFGSSFSDRSGLLKVVRGGGFMSNEWDCRIFERNFKAPDSQDSDLGFRCVKNIK